MIRQSLFGNLLCLVSSLLLLSLLVGCDTPSAAPSPITPSPIKNAPPSPTSPQSATLGGFPFAVGTTWVYSRVAYEQTTGDYTKIVTGTQVFTDTVTQVEGAAPSLSFALERAVGETSVPDGWWTSSPINAGQYLYRIDGSRILSIRYPNSQEGGLVYDFPLSVGKSWCPGAPPPQNPTCQGNARVVRNLTTVAAPVGAFDGCYEIVEEYTSGGVHEWFCPGVGIVARKYDHAGTRFGYEDKLIGYLRGSSRP